MTNSLDTAKEFEYSFGGRHCEGCNTTVDFPQQTRQTQRKFNRAA